MSLINDALRRAWQARRPPAKPADGPAMTPADTSPPARWPVAAVPLLLMGVLLVAVWFLQQGLQPARQPAESAPQASVAAREPPPDEAAAPHLSPEGPGSEAAVGAATGATVDPTSAAQSASPTETLGGPALAQTNFASTEPATATAAAPPVPAPTNPPLKLKAIFYRPSDPWAMINSKTVRIGDRYGSARVVAITPDSVTLVGDGQTNVLTLEH